MALILYSYVKIKKKIWLFWINFNLSFCFCIPFSNLHNWVFCCFWMLFDTDAAVVQTIPYWNALKYVFALICCASQLSGFSSQPKISLAMKDNKRRLSYHLIDIHSVREFFGTYYMYLTIYVHLFPHPHTIKSIQFCVKNLDNLTKTKP